MKRLMAMALWVLMGFLMPGMMFASAQPWVQQAELTASPIPLQFLSDFGFSVSVSADGRTVAVGGLRTNGYSGAVYVYIRTGPTWTSMTQVAKLTASDSSAEDLLGISVSVSADGSTIVAGADEADTYRGAVYVFLRPSGGWTNVKETAKLTEPHSSNLGESVSISADGSVVAAGAPYGGIGAVYVFTKPKSGWKSMTQSAKLTASDGREFDLLGLSVSISSDGSTVATSSIAEPTSIYFLRRGTVYMFVRPATGWADETQTAELTASDAANNDELGSSVALSADGSTVAAGAIRADDLSSPNATQNHGAVYVFERPTTGWADEAETAKLTASDAPPGYSLGTSVAMSASGSVIVAEVPFYDTIPQAAAYVFDEPAGGWNSANRPQYASAQIPAPANQRYTSGGSGRFSLAADGLTFVAGFPDSLEATVFSDAVQFAHFHTHGLKFSAGNFVLNARFILSRESDGIDPAGEPVTLVIGSQVLAFPAGSFKQNATGDYVFSGVVDGVTVNAQIKVLGSQMYQFLI